MVVKRNRTSSKYVGYGLYLFFLGLSYRNTSKALSRFVRRSHMYPYGNGFKSTDLKESIERENKRKQTTDFIINETIIKIGSDYMWV